jgi:hypothetical protein
MYGDAATFALVPFWCPVSSPASQDWLTTWPQATCRLLEIQVGMSDQDLLLENVNRRRTLKEG